MKTNCSNRGSIDIGFMALPVLCSILAGIVFLSKDAGRTTHEIWGDYFGPYVLIECVEDGAIITPPGEKLPLKPSKQQIQDLLQLVDETGYVAIVVRPSGFKTSHNEFRELIREHVSNEKQKGRSVGYSVFPLEEGKPLPLH